MKLAAKEYKYAVVNFLQRPRDDTSEFVCIPHSWIRIRRVTQEKSIVAYPNERSSVTQRRIEDGEQPSEKWNLYLAVVKLETYTYEDAKCYILEKKYGVAADDLCTSVNKRRNPIKRPQVSESQLEASLNKSKVVEVTNKGSFQTKISGENVSSVPNKNQPFTYPYLQEIPDFSKDNSPDDYYEHIIKKSSCISRDFLDSMKRHLLGSQKAINQNQVPAEKISKESSVAEPPQIPLDNKNYQDFDIQLMLVDDAEVTEDAEVLLDPDDSSVRSSPPGVSTEEIDHSVDYPIEKIGTQANCIAKLLETMEKSHLHSSERILEVNESYERSIELLKLIKNSYNSKKLDMNKEKQPEVETHGAEMKSDNVKSCSSPLSSSSFEDEDEEDKPSKKSPKSLRTFVLPPEYDPKDTRWTLKYRENDPDHGLVELVPGSKVFLSPIKLAHCKRMSKDCNTLARMLLAEIFSQSALSVCSLTGAKANAFHNNGTYVRPGLDSNARTTMLAYVEKYAREKQWAPFDKQSVINSVRSRVQEIRSKHART